MSDRLLFSIPFLPHVKITVRLIRDIIIFAVMIITTMLLLWPVQMNIHRRMEQVCTIIFSNVKEFIGRDFSYNKLSLSLFGTLKAENFIIESYSSAAPLLTVKELDISFSLIDLIQGDMLRGLRRVRLKDPHIALDIERDASIVQYFTDTSSVQKSPHNPLKTLLSFDIQNGAFRMQTPNSTVAVQDLTFRTVFTDQQINFFGSLKAEAQGENLKAQSVLTISGNSSFDFRTLDATAMLELLNVEQQNQLLFSMQPFSCTTAMYGGMLYINKQQDDIPLSFSALYDLGADSWFVSAKSSNVSLGDFLTLGESWNQYSAVVINGNASLHSERGTDLLYTFDMTGAVPDIQPVGTVRFALKGDGTAEYVNTDYITVELFGFYAQFQGVLALNPFTVNGSMSFSPHTPPTATITTSDNIIVFKGDNADPMAPLRSEGTMQLHEEGFDASFSLAYQELNAVPTQLSLEVFYDNQPHNLELWLTLNNLKVRDIKNIINDWEIPDIVQDITVNAELFASTDFNHITYNIPAGTIKSEFIDLSTALSGTEQWVDLHEGIMVINGTALQLKATVNFDDPQNIVFNIEASNPDINYQFDGVILDKYTLHIQGIHDLEVHLTRAENGSFSGYCDVEQFPIPYSGQYALVTLLSTFRYESPDSWSLNVDNAAVIMTPLSISMNGSADQYSASFTIQGGDGISGVLTGAWEPELSAGTVQVQLNDSTGIEQCGINATWDSDQAFFDVDMQRVHIPRWLNQAADTTISARASGTWDLKKKDDFRIELFVNDLATTVAHTPLTAQSHLSLNSNTITMINTSIRYGNLEFTIPAFEASRTKQQLFARAYLFGDMRNTNADISLNGTFAPIDSWFKVHEALRQVWVKVSVRNAAFQGIKSDESFQLIFSKTLTGLSLNGGPKNMLRFSMNTRGDFYAGVSAPSPVRGFVTGRIENQQIDAQASNVYVDLEKLYQLIPEDFQAIYRMPGGFITGDMHITGTLSDPEFLGVARGNSVHIQVPPYIGDDIRPVPFTVIADGKTMSFTNVPFASGSGKGMVSGTFVFGRWVPETLSLHIIVPDSSPIPINFTVLAIGAKGTASGNFDIGFDRNAFTMNGDFTVHNTDITFNAQGLENVEPIGSSLLFDVNIHTGRKVVFLWPVADFPILQANAEPGATIHISNDTSANHFSIVGDIPIQSGEIFYFERNFYIREGVISFNENQFHFEPKITARAEIRDRTNSGPVTIYMIVDHAPLASFTARFESTPVLSQAEIFTLLGQNAIALPSSLLISTTDIIGQTQVMRHIERRIRDLFKLDVFSLRIQLVQNMLAQVTNPQSTVDKPTIGNYVDNTSVFIGKYFGQDMFIQFLGQFHYDRTKSSVGGIVIEPDFSFELRGPTLPHDISFDIRGNFSPRNRDHLWVDDLSFSFFWRKSF
ncbi:MAG: translocation/assembly module TamB [Treponema sp.]|jgi:hypothetical protein|nr:translocation/assembly module TamB [Treponema sp.]